MPSGSVCIDWISVEMLRHELKQRRCLSVVVMALRLNNVTWGSVRQNFNMGRQNLDWAVFFSGVRLSPDNMRDCLAYTIYWGEGTNERYDTLVWLKLPKNRPRYPTHLERPNPISLSEAERSRRQYAGPIPRSRALYL